MCGISGIYRFDRQRVERQSILEMSNSIRHRGPDDEGIHLSGSVGLGFVRLAILDLSTTGHQPMHSNNSRYTIVFNGEIYNYIEIREHLKTKGVQFNGHSDTEVLLKSYEVWGESCLEKLNGMFAFGIYDHHSGTLFLARDRFGIKPLYYYADSNKLIFASEIRAIASQLPQDSLQINEQAVFDYLVHNRTDHTSQTFYSQIKKLQHSHCATVSQEGVQIRRWYTLANELKDPFDSPAQYRAALGDSIKLQLRSDVPVGVSLSGGLDSSSIVSSLIHDFNKKDVHTFSAVYGSKETGDESRYIREYQSTLENMHFVKPNSDTLYQDLTTFINAHGEPVQSTGPYAQYKVMQLAKKHVKVTLDGQGADEALAGYHYFFGIYFKELLKTFKLHRFITENLYFLAKAKSSIGVQSLLYFLMPTSFRTNTMVRRKGYIHPDLIKTGLETDIISEELDSAQTLGESLINHFELKLEHLLKWEDRNSMHNSIEARVPFLDHNLVEKTLSLASHELLYHGETKSILRRAMKGVVPQPILSRKDKIGFGTPQDQWFREPKFKALIEHILLDNNEISLFIDTQHAYKLYKSHLTGDINIGQDIWKWINLNTWLTNTNKIAKLR